MVILDGQEYHAVSNLEEYLPIIEIFVDSGLCSSRSEAKRMQNQGALYIWPVEVPEEKERIPIGATHANLRLGDVLQAGKRKFIRLVK